MPRRGYSNSRESNLLRLGNAGSQTSVMPLLTDLKSRSRRSYLLPFSHRRLKKISRIRSSTGSTVAPTRLPLYRTSRRPSSPPPSCPHHHGMLPHDCTAAACSSRKAAPPDCCCHLHRGHRVRPIAGGRTAARPLPSSFSTVIA
jgi:hypothetical protein